MIRRKYREVRKAYRERLSYYKFGIINKNLNNDKKGSNGMVKPNLLIRNYNKYNSKEYLSFIVNKKKNKKGSSRMVEPNCLIHGDCIYNNEEYLNISVDSKKGHARVAEWSLQLFDTQCPFGVVGSIPTSGVTHNSNKNINKINLEITN